MTALSNLFTERDNATLCSVRCGLIAGLAVYLGLSVLNWSSFNAESFGLGLASVIGAGGVGIGVKSRSESVQGGVQ